MLAGPEHNDEGLYKTGRGNGGTSGALPNVKGSVALAGDVR